jgi:hypothetical protein
MSCRFGCFSFMMDEYKQNVTQNDMMTRKFSHKKQKVSDNWRE